jgi:hypothetical protein
MGIFLNERNVHIPVYPLDVLDNEAVNFYNVNNRLLTNC